MARNKGVHAKLSRRRDAKKKNVEKQQQTVRKPVAQRQTFHSRPKTRKDRFFDFYDQHYKKLMLIPMILLLLAIGQIGMQYAATGQYFDQDVSLSGGLTMTILRAGIDAPSLESALTQEYGPGNVAVRTLRQTGEQLGVIIEAGTQVGEEDLVRSVESGLGGLSDEEYSVEITSSSLGQAFFTQLFTALLLAFAFMAIVVFIYFRSWAPSLAVIVAAASDIIETVAVLNLLEVKLSAAGIAALLMLIGYSVDTDMLLSTRVIKRKEGSLHDRMFSALKPGLMMTITTLTSVSIAYIFTQSEVLRQIMLIVIIGLVIDMINTWLFNTGILVYWMRHRRSAK